PSGEAATTTRDCERRDSLTPRDDRAERTTRIFHGQCTVQRERSNTPSTTCRVRWPTAAPEPRTTPATQRIWPADSTSRTLEPCSRGTFASTRTSWSLRVPLPCG